MRLERMRAPNDVPEPVLTLFVSHHKKIVEGLSTLSRGPTELKDQSLTVGSLTVVIN